MITKPVISNSLRVTLDMKFVVKSIVRLDKLAISGFEYDSKPVSERHPVVEQFIERFAQDPVAACEQLVDRSSPKVDTTTLASLIFKTPELDKEKTGLLLSTNEAALTSFVDRFHLSGVVVEDAIRMFLLSVRLPGDPMATDTLLRGFADRYFEANSSLALFPRHLVYDLVIGMLELDDSLHGGTFGFALPNRAITAEVFIESFHSKDTQHLVPDDRLRSVFTSIYNNRLTQALSSEDAATLRSIDFVPPQLPARLTYNTWSDAVAVRIPTIDRDFRLRLMGEGLQFDPSVLDFQTNNEAVFRVRGVLLGTKSILFDRLGPNA